MLTLPGATRAQETDTSSGNNDTTSVAKPPAPLGLPLPAMLRNKVGENIGHNENIRNQRLENRGEIGTSTRTFIDNRDASGTPQMYRFEHGDGDTTASSTRENQGFLGNDRPRGDMRNASSSQEYRGARGDIRKDEFTTRKDTLAKQLDISIQNLKQIRERINSRITKAEQDGRDMTEAKRLLVIADTKITLAEQALTTFKAVTPTASSTASTTLDMSKPRQVADQAISSSKNAHEALVAVVQAIAHAMGLDLGNTNDQSKTGSSTPSQEINNNQ